MAHTYVNPNDGKTASETQLEAETIGLETDPLVNRKLTTHVSYRSWSALANPNDSGILADISNHRVPIISWGCHDDMTLNKDGDPLNLVDIANGVGDKDIVAIADSLNSLQSVNGQNYPILLRYFWEMNRNAAGVQPLYDNADVPDNDKCFLPSGTYVGYPNEMNAPDLPTQFIQAWSERLICLES